MRVRVAIVLPPREAFSPDASGAIGLLAERPRSQSATICVGLDRDHQCRLLLANQSAEFTYKLYPVRSHPIMIDTAREFGFTPILRSCCPRQRDDAYSGRNSSTAAVP